MPNRPNISKLNATATDILNVIRANASANYQDFVPVATTDRESVREIGSIIMQYPALQNEFLNSLINRIGRVIITSKMYQNPWAVFKKGILEFGENVEEIFVNIADPNNYDVKKAENDVFKRKIPDVRTAFHVLNYQKFYKATIQNKQLQQAFLSWTGISDLIARIVDSMYTGAYYDEYQTMKYMLAKAILNGYMYPVQIPEATPVNAKSIVTTVKGVSNALEFMNTKYNVSGVATHTKKSRQVVLVSTEFDSTMDVEVLASAFNMSKAEFMGRRVLMDSFDNMDVDRLASLLGLDKKTDIVIQNLTALKNIPAVLVDEDWFMIFDNLYEFTEQYNGEGLYWNYWYHVWKTFSYSPFANAVVFVSGEPSVTAITLSPDTASVTAGQKLLITANVTATNFASKAVIWSIDSVVDSESAPITDADVNIDAFGNLFVGNLATGSVITVKATSKYNPRVTATATITVN